MGSQGFSAACWDFKMLMAILRREKGPRHAVSVEGAWPRRCADLAARNLTQQTQPKIKFGDGKEERQDAPCWE